MCTTCGCAAGETRIDGEAVHGHDHEHWHVHADGTAHAHPPANNPYRPAAPAHAHRHGDAAAAAHESAGSVHYGHGPAGAHAPGMSQSRMVQIERDILSKNDAYAAQNRARFLDQGIFALNLVSSPGSGKTTLLCRTIDALKTKHALAVIEGDQQTSHDAERIRATGAPALQINTGKGCHLDALMVGHAVQKLAPADASLLFIENVGNLVCPAAFDLGEAHKVAILSVTEGEDKPLKYPDMFRAASLMLVNKIDLLPYVNFKLDEAIAHARRVNPQLAVIRVSATSGEGFAEWLGWIEAGLAAQAAKRQETVASLKRRIAELEARLAQG
ncbi:hydrogenase nickel incorporation protein HypB [Azospira restricta]|uniref:Hydrogenase maturation factor HypB n=1 Tax=Azospira restricta TaxID=404405 RepID=A0A974Y4Q1_9RHOO|nr:hydrogenase nickel incorporation protein HypB [Azospira restricta]QRJ64715.1 hydrogenase nickel incorporation protein HypB [Azospira restricta]